MAGRGNSTTPPFLKRCLRRLGNSATPPPLKRFRRRLIGLGIINEILPDDVLVQILCCLPFQSAVRCKLVCKRWLSLISTTPNFISCSISQQIQQQHDDDEKYPIFKAHGRYLFLTSSQLLNHDISFSFLPCSTMSALDNRIEMSSLMSTSDNKFEIKILASSDDLFLCTKWPGNETPNFICNPFTKEWFELPPPPPSTAIIDPHYVFGFTHKPYYHMSVEEGSEQRVLVNSSCRFRVVRLKTWRASEFEVDIFSSETWQWITCMMRHSSHPNVPSSSISRNGLVYWLCSLGQVIIHDPYNNKVCHVADLRWPPHRDDFPGYNFSVSQGSLFAFDKYSKVVSVWELEDEDCDGHQQPKWRFVTRSSHSSCPEMKTIGVHPNDRNIIYFYTASGGGLFTLSLRTGFKRRFAQELVGIVNNCRLYEDIMSKVAAVEMVVFKAPYWPTPISALLNSRKLAPPS